MTEYQVCVSSISTALWELSFHLNQICFLKGTIVSTWCHLCWDTWGENFPLPFSLASSSCLSSSLFKLSFISSYFFTQTIYTTIYNSYLGSQYSWPHICTQQWCKTHAWQAHTCTSTVYMHLLSQLWMYKCWSVVLGRIIYTNCGFVCRCLVANHFTKMKKQFSINQKLCLLLSMFVFLPPKIYFFFLTQFDEPRHIICSITRYQEIHWI